MVRRRGTSWPRMARARSRMRLSLQFTPLNVAGDGGDVDVELGADLAVVEALDVVELQATGPPGGNHLRHGTDQSAAKPGHP